MSGQPGAPRWSDRDNLPLISDKTRLFDGLKDKLEGRAKEFRPRDPGGGLKKGQFKKWAQIDDNGIFTYIAVGVGLALRDSLDASLVSFVQLTLFDFAQADKHTLVCELGIPYRDLRVLDPTVSLCSVLLAAPPSEPKAEGSTQEVLVELTAVLLAAGCQLLSNCSSYS